MQAGTIKRTGPSYDETMPKGRPTTEARTEFGRRLLAAREELGLSQAEVAAQLGLTQSAYADWERHPVALRPEQIQTLIRVLDISAEYLFGETKKRTGRGGPPGKLRRVFDQVAALPRRQQNKIIEVVEALTTQKASR